MPASTRMSVLLPAPFSPTRAWISPRRSTRSTASSATTPGKRFVTPRRATIGGAASAGSDDPLAASWRMRSPASRSGRCRHGDLAALDLGLERVEFRLDVVGEELRGVVVPVHGVPDAVVGEAERLVARHEAVVHDGVDRV